MKCPVCRKEAGHYKVEGIEPGSFKREPYPLYQKGYPDEKEYVSERCLDCYDKGERAMVNVVTDIEKLRKPTAPAIPDDNLPQLAKTLFTVMKETNGRGLSANQIGWGLSVFVMKQDRYSPICIVNPVLTRKKGQQKRNEGCLSLPGVQVTVTRPQIVKVKGYNQYWVPVTYSFRGIEAACVCHEMDHLVGRLITDYEEK